MALRHGALASNKPHRHPPASNKPHPAEKSTPVWLAIWHTWAGFANSQLLPDAAALSSMQGLPWSGNSSAQTSASLHPPAALRLRSLGVGGRGLCEGEAENRVGKEALCRTKASEKAAERSEVLFLLAVVRGASR